MSRVCLADQWTIFCSAHAKRTRTDVSWSDQPETVKGPQMGSRALRDIKEKKKKGNPRKKDLLPALPRCCSVALVRCRFVDLVQEPLSLLARANPQFHLFALSSSHSPVPCALAPLPGSHSFSPLAIYGFLFRTCFFFLRPLCSSLFFSPRPLLGPLVSSLFPSRNNSEVLSFSAAPCFLLAETRVFFAPSGQSGDAPESQRSASAAGRSHADAEGFRFLRRHHTLRCGTARCAGAIYARVVVSSAVLYRRRHAAFGHEIRGTETLDCTTRSAGWLCLLSAAESPAPGGALPS